MLINVNPLLSPEILLTLRSMGHGDRIVLSDANFPSYSHAQKIHRMDGLNIPQAAAALLSVFPLDSFIKSKHSKSFFQILSISAAQRLLQQTILFCTT